MKIKTPGLKVPGFLILTAQRSSDFLIQSSASAIAGLSWFMRTVRRSAIDTHSAINSSMARHMVTARLPRPCYAERSVIGRVDQVTSLATSLRTSSDRDLRSGSLPVGRFDGHGRPVPGKKIVELVDLVVMDA